MRGHREHFDALVAPISTLLHSCACLNARCPVKPHDSFNKSKQLIQVWHNQFLNIIIMILPINRCTRVDRIKDKFMSNILRFSIILLSRYTAKEPQNCYFSQVYQSRFNWRHISNEKHRKVWSPGHDCTHEICFLMCARIRVSWRSYGQCAVNLPSTHIDPMHSLDHLLQ